MEIVSKSPGDPCPKCGQPLQRREAMFHWRGDTRPGAYCPACNAVWSMAGEEIEPLRPTSEQPQ